MNSTAWIWIFVLPLVSSPLVYLVGRIWYSNRTQEHTNPSRWAGLAVMLACWVPFISDLLAYQKQGPLSFTLNDITLRLDGISLLLAGTVLVIGTLATLFSGSYLAKEEGQEKFYALLVAMIGAMIGLGCTNDLFNLWVWFETMAVASYMLVAFHRDQPGALEAGVKYLVQGAAGSILVLMGIALVFSQTGTLALDGIRKVAEPSWPLLAAGGLFIIGFGVKIALVPLHTWLPDAHSQAPSGISAMLSGVVIETGLVALLRALGSLALIKASGWGGLLLGFGILNMVVGNLMALRQTQVKRLLAYSSLSHIGYMLVGLGIAISFNQANGAIGSFFHLFNHALMKGLAFLAAGCLLYALHIAHKNHEPLTITDLAGAARRYPLVAFGLSIAVLGLGGLPPLAGFMSKWQIFTAGFQTQNLGIILLVIFAALNSVFSLGYYAPLVNAMYRKEASAVVMAGKPVPLGLIIPVVVLTLAVIVIGVWPSLMNFLVIPAGTDLLAAFGLQ